MSNIAVLIPCYNEEKTIEKVIKKIKKELPKAEIYVGDNNCTDKTAQIALDNGARIIKSYYQGKGNMIRKMIQEIESDIYIMIDGDNTYDIEKISEMVELVESDEYDIVIGNRLATTYFKENKRRFHNFGNVVVNKTINFIFKSNVNDTMSGLRVMNRRFIKNFPILCKGFELETEMTIYMLDNKYHYKEIPIIYSDRETGSYSKLNTYKDGAKVFIKIFDLFKECKPLLFFLSITLFLIFIGTALFIPIIINFVKTGLVPKIPTLIIIVTIYIGSIISLISGIILDSINNKYKKLAVIYNQK